MKSLKSLEEHNERQIEYHQAAFHNQPTPNGIACPNCFSELYDTNPSMVMTSMPPQKQTHCNCCGFSGYRVA